MKEDIATVEKRLQDLLRAKDSRCKKVRLLTGALAPDLDTHAGRDDASDGATACVWGGGRGGAFTPPSEQPFSVGRLDTGNSTFSSGNNDLGRVNVSLENSFSDLQGISAGVLMKVKKSKVLEQVQFFPCSNTQLFSLIAKPAMLVELTISLPHHLCTSIKNFFSFSEKF